MLIFTVFFLFSSFAQDFSIASYNLHNLFDTKATKGHDDFTYLPKNHALKKECEKESNSYYKRICQRTDWTEDKLKKRIQNLQKVIESFPKEVSLLALVEVETLALGLEIGQPFGLDQGVVTTGTDRRGIQSALLYNSKIWKLIETKEFPFDFKTRNLLEVRLLHKKNKKEVTVFVNHWPSQGSPTEKRLVVAKKLAERMKAHKQMNVLALGDFNTLPKENPHPIHREILTLEGVNEFFFEGGTYFYAPKMSWNSLDRLFFGKGLRILEGRVIKPTFATTVFEYTDKKRDFWGSRVMGVPKKAKPMKKKNLGFSDHFPIFATIEFKK